MKANKKILIILLVGFATYYQVLFNGFVWDDTTYILGNQELQGLNFIKLIGPNMFNSSGYFRPLPAIYFSLLTHLFENSAFFFHLTQLILHFICTVVLYKLFKKYFSENLSLFLSIVFLVHPINVESVAYIGSTQSQLYFLFGTLALLSIDSIKTHLYLLLALFTKEVGFLYFILIYIKKNFENIIIHKKFWLTSVLSLVLYLGIRFMSLGHIAQKMHLIPISEISLMHRLMHIPALHNYYLKTFFYPRVLAIDQIWVIKDFNLHNFYLPLIFVSVFYIVAAFILIYLVKIKSKKALTFTFFMIWYLLGIAMLSQIFPLDMTVADRWFYFPIVGLLGMFGVLLSMFKKVIVGPPLSILIIFLLMIRTFVRVQDWRSALTLYRHDAPLFENYDLENYLGYELAQAGLLEEAINHFHRAVQLLPHDTNLYNLGSMYERIQNYPKAIEYYTLALSTHDKYLNHDQIRELAFQGLTKILIIKTEYKQASDYLRQAVAQFPSNGTLWSYYAIAQYQQGLITEAIDSAKNARTLLPNPSTEKLFNLINQKKPLNLQ